MEIQHINVKLLVKNPDAVDLDALIPVFHGWIRNQSQDELLLDVADYRHVHSGPGVVLIGHRENYSLDNAGGRLGVRYNRKAALEGTNYDRLVQAAQAALAACQRLESDPRLEGAIQFNGRELEVFVNDRILVPNTPESRSATDGHFRAFLSTLFGDIDYAVSYSADPRSLFSLHVRASRAFDTTALLENLNSMEPASQQR